MNEPNSPWEFACKWYGVDEIEDTIQQTCKVPLDVHSREFAEWLTNEYRLAMAKGIQIGRDQFHDEDESDAH